MKAFFAKHARLLFLIPLAYLIYTTFSYEDMTTRINDSLLRQKRIEVNHEVEILFNTLDGAWSISEEEYAEIFARGIEYVDNLPAVYAAAYRETDGGLILCSQRNDDGHAFDPFDYPEFVAMVGSQGEGSAELVNTLDDGSTRNMITDFKWGGTDGAEYGMLAITGVSFYSIAVPMADEVTTMQIINIAITFIIIAAAVAVIVSREVRHGGRS